MNEVIKVGDKCPTFKLYNQNRELINLIDFIGVQPLVVFFYPKDETPGCTKEVCTFRDKMDAFTAAGAVFGWPILIALALQRTTSAHVSVIAAVMPLVTAIIAVIKHHKHPGVSFWVASSLGTVLLIAFSITRGGNSNSDLLTDLIILGAVIASSYCYVEGAALTSHMPGWQVISWVVVVSLPIAIPASIVVYANTNSSYELHGDALFGLLAIGFSSMYLGFFAWYRGLRDFGVAHGSQVQQLQAIMTLGWSALILGETVTLTMVISAIGIVLCVLWAISNVNK